MMNYYSIVLFVHIGGAWIAIQTRVSITLGIVFLMTVKPSVSGSLLTIGVATAVGLVSALPILGRGRTQEEPAM